MFFANGQANEKGPDERRYLAFVDEEQENGVSGAGGQWSQLKGEKATKWACAGVASDIEGTQEKCVICEAKLKKKFMKGGRVHLG